jgi:D-inositol-3-phosphate glycosyltransferase
MRDEKEFNHAGVAADESSSILGSAIFFDGELRDGEQQKSLRGETRLHGFDVFLAGFSHALFAHSRYGPIYFTQEAAASFQRNPPAWFQAESNKARYISARDPSKLAGLQRLIMLSVGPEMIQLAWLRSRLHRMDCPITAILHSLQPAPRIRYFFTSGLLGRLGKHDAMVCSSKAAKKALRNIFFSIPEEARATKDIPIELPVIPMGVETQDFRSVTREAARDAHQITRTEIVILCFGRLSPTDKGDVLPLLVAFSQLPELDRTTLLFAGDDTQFRMARALIGAAQEMGCGEHVRVITDVSRQTKLELLAAADIFVSLTENTQESFSLTIAEALASGLPVIASDWSGHDELVEHGITGFIVPTYLPPASAPWHMMAPYSGIALENLLAMSTAVDLDHLAVYLQVLLRSPERRKQMGEAAQKRAIETLDWRPVMRQYDEMWRDLLDRSKSVPRGEEAFECSSFHEVFAHYPTRSLRRTDRLEISRPHRTDMLRLIDVLSKSLYFSAQIFNCVLAVLNEGDTQTIERIMELVSRSHPEMEMEIERHIGRLLKYGVLRITEASCNLKCVAHVAADEATSATSQIVGENAKAATQIETKAI